MLDGMTNIKASEVLKELKDYTEDLPPYSPDEVAEALEMAIKALEAQPCEEDFVKHKKEVLERIAKREREIDKYIKELETLKQQPCEDCISREEAKKFLYEEIEQLHDDGLYDCFSRIIDDMYNELPSVTPRINLAETSQDCISRQKALDCFEQTNTRQGAKYAIEKLPSVKPQYTDEEIDKAQAVEQAYVDKMVELAVEESRKKWLNSFDTSSATKCFEAVNILKQRLEGEE